MCTLFGTKPNSSQKAVSLYTYFKKVVVIASEIQILKY